MASGKDIRREIRSIRNTQKITGAMELVAASKMRKSQERMLAGRPYSENILSLIYDVADASAEYVHPFMKKRPRKSIGIIIVSSDRGLCGGLNYSLFRSILLEEEKWRAKGMNISRATLGKKGAVFFKGAGGPQSGVEAERADLGDYPAVSDINGVLHAMLESYTHEKIDALYLGSNRFANTMTQQPNILQLLPLPEQEGEEKQKTYNWDYIYEPEAPPLMDKLLHRYLESIVYQSVLENIACEQAARMIAMKSATDNAVELIDELELLYNKARQALITQEISEIVSGAAALS